MTKISFTASAVYSLNAELRAHPRLKVLNVVTESDIARWADEQNVAVDALSAHYPGFVSPNCLSVDLTTGRLEPRLLADLLTFCSTHDENVVTIAGGRALYERASREHHDARYWLGLSDKSDNGFFPISNPRAKTVIYPSIGNHWFRSKCERNSVIHLAYATVDAPLLMRRHDYVCIDDNVEYRNSKGECFLLVPSLFSANKRSSVLWEVFTDISHYVDISLAAFVATLYGCDVPDEELDALSQEPADTFYVDTFRAYMQSCPSDALSVLVIDTPALEESNAAEVARTCSTAGVCSTPNAMTIALLFVWRFLRARHNGVVRLNHVRVVDLIAWAFPLLLRIFKTEASAA